MEAPWRVIVRKDEKRKTRPLRHGFSILSRNTPKVDKGRTRGNIENVRKTTYKKGVKND